MRGLLRWGFYGACLSYPFDLEKRQKAGKLTKIINGLVISGLKNQGKTLLLFHLKESKIMLASVRSYIPFLTDGFPLPRAITMVEPNKKTQSIESGLTLQSDVKVLGFSVQDIPNLTREDVAMSLAITGKPLSRDEARLLHKYGYDPDKSDLPERTTIGFIEKFQGIKRLVSGC